MDNSRPKILARLNIDQEHWLTLTTQFETCFKQAAGKVIHLEQYAHHQQQKRVYGRQNAMRLLGEPHAFTYTTKLIEASY